MHSGHHAYMDGAHHGSPSSQKANTLAQSQGARRIVKKYPGEGEERVSSSTAVDSMAIEVASQAAGGQNINRHLPKKNFVPGHSGMVQHQQRGDLFRNFSREGKRQKEH